MGQGLVRQQRAPLAIASVMLAAVLGLTGCTLFGGPSPPSRFYLLQPLEAADAAPDGPVVGVGPIRVPEYLDRPQIVTRPRPHELQLAEFERWGEPFAASVGRVLAANLGVLLHTDRVRSHPFRDARSLEVQIEVDITRFEGPRVGPVELVAHWRVRRGGVRVERTSRIQEPLNDRSYPEIAAGMSRALAALSREIAAAADPSR